MAMDEPNKSASEWTGAKSPFVAANGAMYGRLVVWSYKLAALEPVQTA